MLIILGCSGFWMYRYVGDTKIDVQFKVFLGLFGRDGAEPSAGPSAGPSFNNNEANPVHSSAVLFFSDHVNSVDPSNGIFIASKHSGFPPTAFSLPDIYIEPTHAIFPLCLWLFFLFWLQPC